MRKIWNMLQIVRVCRMTKDMIIIDKETGKEINLTHEKWFRDLEEMLLEGGYELVKDTLKLENEQSGLVSFETKKKEVNND